MRRLFEQRPWYKLKPDQSVLASEPGRGPFRVVAARAEDGSFVIAYLPRRQAGQRSHGQGFRQVREGTVV